MRLSERPIGDLVDKCQTWNPKASGPGSFDYIDLSSVDKDKKAIASIERHECSEAPSRARQLVEAGDVLVATVRPNLNGVALVDGAHHRMTASTGYCVLRPNKNKLDSKFLFHWVKTGVFVQRMVDVATGANYPAVSDAKVKASTIPLPPLADQKRIAGILDAADALRAKRRESLAQLDALLQSTFLDMFGDPVTNPMGWEVGTIGDIADVKGGKRLPKGEAYSEVPTDYRYIRVSNLRPNDVQVHDLKYLQPETRARIARYIVNPGDVIISIAGTIGITAAVPEDLGGANLTENAAKIVFRDRETMDAVYLSYSLQMPHAQYQIAAHTGQVTIGKLALFRIQKITIPLPPIETQHRFTSIVESVEQQKARQRAHLDELDTLFASLQSRAFRGDL